MKIWELSEKDFGDLVAEITTMPEFIDLVTFGFEDSGDKVAALKEVYKKYGLAVKSNYDLLSANRHLTKRLCDGTPQWFEGFSFS